MKRHQRQALHDTPHRAFINWFIVNPHLDAGLRQSMMPYIDNDKNLENTGFLVFVPNLLSYL